MAGKKPVLRDLSTEEKIKKAALKLFTRKGYAATRTRDISKEAGINLALLNYYFRSKEKLFELVMTEVLQHFFADILQIFNDEETTVDEKVQLFVARYTKLLMKQPELPLFIFNEIMRDPDKLAARMGVKQVFSSVFLRQLKRTMEEKKIRNVHPLNYIINLVAMCVFPFIGAPLFRHVGGLNEKNYKVLVEERIEHIPVWMRATMKKS